MRIPIEKVDGIIFMPFRLGEDSKGDLVFGGTSSNRPMGEVFFKACGALLSNNQLFILFYGGINER